MEKIVKVVRVLIYEGPEEWVEEILKQNFVIGAMQFANGASIKELPLITLESK